MEEAAKIDGCGRFHTYIRIALPIAQPALLVCSILSIVWHWNDFVEPGYFLMSKSKLLLPAMLPNMYLMAQSGGAADQIGDFVFTEGMAMAGSFLVILPILLVYALLQRRFMTSIEQTGLVG
jgi:multiple sugar transport system permease protein